MLHTQKMHLGSHVDQPKFGSRENEGSQYVDDHIIYESRLVQVAYAQCAKGIKMGLV